MKEKLLTLPEAARLLSMSPEEVERWVQEGRLPAFQIGGLFLRFRREEIDRFKRERLQPPAPVPARKRPLEEPYGFLDGLKDFFYFNDFYLASLLLVLIALWAILTI